MSPIKTLLLLLIASLCTSVVQAAQEPLLQNRHLFEQARNALQSKNIPLYQQLHAQLNDYPLQPYLDYLYLRQRLDHTSVKTIDTFLQQQDDTFYADRLRTAWLDKLAKEKRWQDYLHFYRAPQSAEKQCYQLQALLQTGQRTKAFEQTRAMWLVPHSQHKACDPVFSQWQQAGLLTPALFQQRMMLALRDNQFSIARYLAKNTQHSASNLALVQTWKNMHENPYSLLGQVADSGEKILNVRDAKLAREIVMYGISRMARLSPEKAYQRWLALDSKLSFNAHEISQARRHIGLWAALNRDEKALIYYGNIAGGEWHARAALWQKDWRTAIKVINALPDEEQKSTRWQYWLGRSQQALGDKQRAEQTLTAILGQRDYYSFLASDLLDKPYQMNHHPIQSNSQELLALKQQPALQRLKEFYQHNMMLEARREAHHLQQTRTAHELQLMALLVHDWGWHNQAIAMLGKARYWDALDLRFPVIYGDTISNAGEKQNLDPSWLLAIARQESAFNPQAHSHAGAMGLMQIMPATGRMISKQVQQPLTDLSELYQPERNIMLGSAYLRHVYDDNQQNPVLATAAYNAGPHRVSHWLPDTQLAADIWAENIPYNETRHYVQTVMSYAAIFDSQRKQAIKPISARMPAIQPNKALE